MVFTDPDPLAVLFTIEHGESIPNTQMAIQVLPIMATLIQSYDAQLASDMQQLATSLIAPVQQVFGTKYVASFTSGQRERARTMIFLSDT